MRYATRAVAAILGIAVVSAAAHGDLRDDALRAAVLKWGLEPAESLYVPEPVEKVDVGKLLFESKLISLNANISCQNCHLDKFGSADGIPNAIGVGGVGEGTARMNSGGAILPRNALPFWGRGEKGFKIFFWDGRVDASGDGIISQFGSEAPSTDPLVVAAHLPPVEIREMLVDDQQVREEFQHEDVEIARGVYDLIAKRIRGDDTLSTGLSSAYQIPRDKIEYRHIAESIAAFIRTRFAIKETKLHRFAFSGGELTDDERSGGIIFYGKGRCAGCHNGPYFSDFAFHAIPFPEAGFGKNGFGVDYGRYNVTFDPDDLYKFRTPPLYNVTKTAPYSHSGSLYRLEDAVRAHFDPLSLVDTKIMVPNERREFYERLKAWGKEEIVATTLSEEEIKQVVAFLSTLSFE